MTTANKITIFRLLLVPLFVMEVLYFAENGNDWYRIGALLTFAMAAILDGVDGFIARRFNQRSALGAVLDPMADKLLLVSGIVLLTRHVHPELDRIPFWLTVLVFGRDLVLLIGLGVIYYTCDSARVQPHPIGKIATVLQMATVLWILLRWPSAWLQYLVWGTGISTAVSGCLYVVDGLRQISASPHSAATPGQQSKRNSANNQEE
ncbi:MAG: CDP-alcohol phosphatidyltransferase family protein [Pedosphaera sp.]|nr:CDP-alcohol phosphatidyltransferase family protein [Pedosphaera sp.]